MGLLLSNNETSNDHNHYNDHRNDPMGGMVVFETKRLTETPFFNQGWRFFIYSNYESIKIWRNLSGQ